MVKPKVSWQFDAERFPDQRSNWKNMSKSNKRYTVEQYNKARKNRGLAPIPNPFKEGGETYRLAPGTSLAAKFPSFVGVETITPVSTNTKKIYPKGHVKFDPIVKYLTKESDEGIMDFSDEELAGLLQTPKFIQLLDQLESNPPSSSVSDPLNTAGTSGKGKVRFQSEFESPPKKPNLTSTPIKSSDMHQPGTGHHSDMDLSDPLNETTRSGGSINVAAGHGTSGGLAMEKGEFIPEVPRPYNFRMMDGFGHITNSFSVLSYGFATRLLPHPGNPTPVTTTSANILLATTPLLEIPWDRVNMYINPGVYESLPTGAYVKSVHCKVIQRNVRVAFETAASTTTLATLNQNKFTLVATGLNNKNDIRVTNMRYNVSSQDESMVPTGLTDPAYNDIDECLYGYPQTDAKFNGLATASNSYGVPCVNFSFNTVLHPRNYLVAWNYGYKSAATTESMKNRGWYNLSQHVRKCPTGKVIDQEIVNESYYPTYAPLKGQLDFAEYLRDTLAVTPPSGTVKINVDLNDIQFSDHNIGKQFDKSFITSISARSDSNPSEVLSPITTNKSNFNLLVSRNTLIEKGQFYKQIDSDANGKYIQPSIHIGVASVPKLTTATNQLLPSEFTDVQSYYDVELSMVIGFNYAHQNTYQDVFNINANEIRMAAPVSAAGNRPTHLLPNRFGHQAIY